MSDNAGISAGPQIVVRRNAVTPADGVWEITPNKIWYATDADLDGRNRPFETYDIPSRQGDIANIIALASSTIDEVTSMPAIAQGEQGTDTTKTAQGMALLMNSSNVVFRRWVKNWDDNITDPLITNFYDWHMQFSEKEEIKGDYEIDARGSSVLLVREMQAQNLLMIAQMFGDHPVFGPMLEPYGLMRQIFRSHMMAAADVLKTEREYKQFLSEQKEQVPPEVQVKQEEVAVKREELQKKDKWVDTEWEARTAIANMEYNATMSKMAEALNMKQEDLEARLETARMAAQDKARAAAITAQSKDKSLAVEAAMRQQTGVSSGGAI
jgi:hypothetical protein